MEYLRLYRGTPVNKTDIDLFKKLYNKKVFSKCFLSASTNQEIGRIFSMKNLKGTQVPVLFKIDVELTYLNEIGRDISRISNYPNEKEWLLPYGSHL